MNQDTQFRMSTAKNALVASSGTLSQLAADFAAADAVLSPSTKNDDSQTAAMIEFISAMSQQLAGLDTKTRAFLKTLGVTSGQAPQQAQKSERPQARKWEPASKPSVYDAFNDMFDK